MTLRSEAQGTRIAAEIDAFHEAGRDGLTIFDVMDITGMGYHTVRNDILFLIRNGKIAHSGRIKDKSVIYTAVGRANVPTVLFNNQNVEFNRFIDQAFEGAPTREIDMTKIIRLALVGIAARAKAGPGERLDFYPKTLKTILVEAVNRAETFVTAAKSILDDPRYWNEHQLPDLLDVDKYDQEKLIALTRIYMADIVGTSDEEISD